MARFQPPGPQRSPYGLEYVLFHMQFSMLMDFFLSPSPFQEPNPDHLPMPGPHLDDMYN